MRLTKKEKNRLASYGYTECDYLLNGTPRVKALNKLGQLEDVEDELGIDLVTLFKAIKQGYIYDKFYKVDVMSVDADREQNLLVDFANNCFYNCAVCGKYDRSYYFSDYGKTWVLTKEELE